MLVGTNGGSTGTLADSILAIVRAAIDANRGLRSGGLLDAVRIDAVEFIELYEDTATRAAHVIADLPVPLEREMKADEGLVVKTRVSTCPGRPLSSTGESVRHGMVAAHRRPAEGRRRRSEPAARRYGHPAQVHGAAQIAPDSSRRSPPDNGPSCRSSSPRRRHAPLVDHELSATLYQLLVPAPVRDRISLGSDVLFMLDRVGAGFPFELMAERGNDGKLHPLIERHGILRQFETEQYQTRPEMARSNRLFVIGNPKTLLWPSLPGAEAEAEAVEKVARAHGLQVTHPQNRCAARC